jgi:hypothetical protein
MLRKCITIYALLLIVPAVSYGQVGTVKTTNGITKFQKEYSVGVEHLNIDTSSIPGWSKCTIQPLKVFQNEGQSRMRVDMACYTKGGQMVTFSCSTGKGGFDLSITQLQGTGSKLDTNNNINSSGFLDIALFCEYYR